jgi:hypothetical protein
MMDETDNISIPQDSKLCIVYNDIIIKSIELPNNDIIFNFHKIKNYDQIISIQRNKINKNKILMQKYQNKYKLCKNRYNNLTKNLARFKQIIINKECVNNYIIDLIIMIIFILIHILFYFFTKN